jgi:hypothetical protein
MSNCAVITAVSLLVAVAGPVLAADLPPPGRWEILIENAVPSHPPAQRRGRPHHDLQITLSSDGRNFAERGWAWFEALPGVEHDVRVSRADWTAEVLRLDLEIMFRPQLPDCLGGTARYRLQLQPESDRWIGGFDGTVTGVSDQDALALWRLFGREGLPRFRCRVRDGEVNSLLDPPEASRPVRAVAVLRPVSEPAAAERARLLVGDAERARLVERVKRGTPAQLHAHLADLLAATGRPVTHGFDAAGWGFIHYLTGEATAARRALDAARRSVVAAGDLNDLALAREMAGLAVAYDFCRDTWDAESRQEIGRTLTGFGARIAALDQDPARPDKLVFGPTGALRDVEGPFDCRLATFRAAAGLAVLATLADQPTGERADVAERVLNVVERSVRRFLETGIGENGAGIGNTGYDEAIEIVFPFLRAWRHARGQDLAANTGARRTVVWGIMTRGLGFDQPGESPVGFWLAAGADLAEPRWRPLTRWHWDRHGYRPANPFHALMAILAYPDDVEARSASELMPLAMEDKASGSYVLRSGWQQDREFVTIFECGAHPSGRAASRRGNFSVFGLGREWIRRPQPAPDRAQWLSASEFNVVNVHAAQVGGLQAARPQHRGVMQRVRVRRDGSGSVSMSGEGFLTLPDPRGSWAEVEPVGYPYTPKSWRTMGVDYSGASGAAAALVFVEGHVGLGDRRQAWEADIGEVPAERVNIDGLRFTVWPADTRASLAGTVVYPTTAHIEYQPPRDGRGGRLVIWRSKPEKAWEVELQASLERKIEQISKGFIRQTDDDFENELNIILDLPLVDKRSPDLKALLERQHLGYFAKLYRHSSSTAMGGPNRGPQARASWVIVLTIQEGDPPEVQPVEFPEDELLRIGGQAVDYQEYLIEFRTNP